MTDEIVSKVREAYLLGRNLGEKDGIRFTVKYFLGNLPYAPFQDSINGIVECLESEFYKGKDKQ